MAAKLHKWHRRIGLLASSFIIFLVITGIGLQHSDELGLPTQHLTNSWLLNFYGIKPNPITSYKIGNQIISHTGNHLYLSDKPIIGDVENILGAVNQDDQIIIATSNSLLIIDIDGNILDEITVVDGLAEKLLGITKSQDDSIIIRGQSNHWQSQNDLYHWKEYKNSQLAFDEPIETPPPLRENIENHDMSQHISVERFVLDAHSGRFLGRYGIYIIDLAAVLLLILSLSGIWLWVIRR